MLDRRDLFAKAGAAGMLMAPGVAAQASGGGGVANNVAATLETLRAAPPSLALMLYDGAIFVWKFGDYGRLPLGPADNVNVVAQNETPAATGAWVRQSQILSVRTFGAIEGAAGSAKTNTAAFRRAIDAAAALSVPLHLEGGVYMLDASGAASGGVNFARAGLHIKGGGATLRFKGAGRAFVLDQGGRDGDFLEGISVEDVTIVGEPGVTDGFYSRGVVRSSFRNIKVLDVGGKAFWIRHGVSCHYDGLQYSAHPGGAKRPAVAATHGLYVDNNGAGYYTANCTFTNPVMENFPGVGCQIADGSGNLFVGGTFEGCETGLVVTAPSNDNTFAKIWMEANTASDAVVSGNGNGFLGPKFLSFSFSGPNVRITSESKGTWFAGGGYVRFVDIAEGSSGTTFHQVGVDENAGGAIGFQGRGKYTRIGCQKIRGGAEVVGAYADIVGAVESIGAAGDWSPRLVSARGAISQNAATTKGTFHKIGPLVFAQCFIEVDKASSPAGELSIGQLPYRSAFRQPGAVQATGLQASAADALQVHVDRGGARLVLTKLSGGVAAAMGADIKPGSTIAASITYTVAD